MGVFNFIVNCLMEYFSIMVDGKMEVCMFDEFVRVVIDVICKVRKE